MRTTTRQSGFTLLEVAVVLVVVGLLLGAISIGKDLQRGAEQQIVYSKFVEPWAVAYNEYFARTGVVLGDDQTSPTLQVNQGGNAICGEDIHTLMDAVGIEMPPGRSEGREDRYVYLDTNGNPMQIEVCFKNVNWEDELNDKNVMILLGLNPDLARNLDATIDGRPDAGTGLFRGASGSDPGALPILSSPSAITAGDVSGSIPLGAQAWTPDNRNNFSNATTNLDEEQVVVVTAVYRMNQ